MARNKFPGYCYCCGEYVPVGFGHFERRWGRSGNKWQIKCVKCASGRVVHEWDKEVRRAKKEVKDIEDRISKEQSEINSVLEQISMEREDKGK